LRGLFKVNSPQPPIFDEGDIRIVDVSLASKRIEIFDEDLKESLKIDWEEWQR
jgi:hypothetical protein